MSWSVSATGRAAAVAKKLAEDFARVNCSEPEQTIKNNVASAVDAALTAFPPEAPVRVEASGSQSNMNGAITNQLKVEIAPIWGWVE